MFYRKYIHISYNEIYLFIFFGGEALEYIVAVGVQNHHALPNKVNDNDDHDNDCDHNCYDNHSCA